MKVSLKDLCVRHLATAKNPKGMRGAKVESNGSLTATNGAALVNVLSKEAESQESGFIPEDAFKTLAIQCKLGPTEVQLSPEPVDFPSGWESEVPTDVSPYFTIRLDIELLKTLCKVVTDGIEKGPHGRVLEMGFYGQHRVVTLRSEDGKRTITGLLMPMK